MAFHEADGRGPHGDPATSDRGSEADSTLILQRGGEARSPAAIGEGAAAGPGDGQEPAPSAALSLEHYARDGTQYKRKSWSAKQRRAYQRVRTFMARCAGLGWEMLFVTLTTAPGGDRLKLAYHVKVLLRRIERRFGYEGVVHWMVQTAEGNGVAHLILGWGPKPGLRRREFWIPQRWLSDNWQAIHGARIVDVRKVRTASWGGLARYLVAQYLAGQEGFVRLSWSWVRLFGVPVVQVWRRWKYWWCGRSLREFCQAWELLLRGEIVVVPVLDARSNEPVTWESIRRG